MTQFSAHCRFFSAAALFPFLAIILLSGSIARAGYVYNIKEYSLPDADLPTYQDILSGTLTFDGPLGTYTKGSILGSPTLAAEFTITRNDPSGTTRSQSYSAASLDTLLKKGTITFSASQIVLSTIGQLKFDPFVESGNQYVGVEWNRENNGYFWVTGGDNPGGMALRILDSTAFTSPYGPGDWLIAEAASVPEPGTLLLVSLGLAGVAVARWRPQRGRTARQSGAAAPGE